LAAKFHHGFFAGGPLLFPGMPWIFEVSCCWTVGFCGLALAPEPTVLPRGAAGPLLPPGWPAIPVPEFCALGTVDTSGVVGCVWANAGAVESATIIATVDMRLMMLLLLVSSGSAKVRALAINRQPSRRVPN
jgi:hypothetical protein